MPAAGIMCAMSPCRTPAHALLDAALDRSIVGGYTSIGYRLRAQRFEPLPRLDGRVAIITGATSGLGLAAAQSMAQLGARVVALARDARRGERVRAQLQEAVQGGAAVELELCDLADLASVRAAAQRLRAAHARVDVLVNNASVLPAARQRSPDGHELTFATNVLGPFLLTCLLHAPLRAAGRAGDGPARVITVSSGGMYAQRLDVRRLIEGPEPFDGTAAYAATKRAQVVLTELAAQRAERRGEPIWFAAMHPGWADTPGVRTSLPRFYRLTRPLLRTPAQGADTIVWLAGAVAPLSASGAFWHDRARRPAHLVPWTRESAAERKRLAAECVRLSDCDCDA
jgi:dehydrogenase/reductase SDR family protein 12